MASAGPTWFLGTVSAPRGWQLVFGGPQIDLSRIDWPQIDSWSWENVAVGHLDHGYTGHPATAGIVQPQRGKNLKDSGVQDPRDPMNYDQTFGVHGHCTRTGSVLAGKDRAQPYIGAAPGVPLIPYRVTNRSVMNLPGSTIDEPEGTNVAKAIRDAIDRNGCRVISISLGALFGWREMGLAVDHAYDKGVIIAAAAGQVVNEVVYPGKYPHTICVGGFRPGNWPYWTYRHSAAVQPDIWAPSAEVWRAESELPDDGARTYGYGFGEGTSYGTAMVAGLAALFVRKFDTQLETKGYTGWRRIELFRTLLRRGQKRVRGDVQDGIIVDFPRVLLDPSPVFPWPKPETLQRAPGNAADMRQ